MELIGPAVSSVLRRRRCTRSHVEGALEAGAGRAEIAEAHAVLWVIGSGVRVVWNREGLEDHLRSRAGA